MSTAYDIFNFTNSALDNLICANVHGYAHSTAKIRFILVRLLENRKENNVPEGVINRYMKVKYALYINMHVKWEHLLTT